MHLSPGLKKSHCVFSSLPCCLQIIHLDLKSHNILLGRGGIAKIADVGLAKIMSNSATRASAAGTFDWAAPGNSPAICHSLPTLNPLSLPLPHPLIASTLLGSSCQQNQLLPCRLLAHASPDSGSASSNNPTQRPGTAWVSQITPGSAPTPLPPPTFPCLSLSHPLSLDPCCVCAPLSCRCVLTVWRCCVAEQLVGEKCTEKADIYSLGVVLWELCTLDAPMLRQTRDLM